MASCVSAKEFKTPCVSVAVNQKTDTNSCKTKDKGDQKLEVKVVPLCPSVAGIELFCVVLCCVVL